MAALKRETCSVCGRSVPVRVNGAAREHQAMRETPGGLVRPGGKCSGSGRPTVQAKRRELEART
jgi:hypothetical protein